jgi:hypothetical protein
VENLGKYRGEAQTCFALQSICADATGFVFPSEPMVLYLFNPFPEAGLRHVLESLTQRVRQSPRALYLRYHNPRLEPLLMASSSLKTICGTHQYTLFAAHS